MVGVGCCEFICVFFGNFGIFVLVLDDGKVDIKY